MEYCIIRKVPFKLPATQSRIVWGHIIAENEGLALVLVPKPEQSQPHSIFIAEENVAERVFEPVGSHRFDLESEDLTEAGEKLRMLGRSIEHAEYMRQFRPDDFPPFP